MGQCDAVSMYNGRMIHNGNKIGVINDMQGVYTNENKSEELV